MTTPIVRMFQVLRVVVLAGLLYSVFPAPSVDAARPVCATSKKVHFKRQARLLPDHHVYVWVRGCVVDGELRLEARQKGIGRSMTDATEPVLEGELRVVLHSTSSNGRFLREVELSETLWLGDVAERFNTGATQGNDIVHASSVPLDAVVLPELSAGRYQISFDLKLDYVADDAPAKSTGPRTIKFKV